MATEKPKKGNDGEQHLSAQERASRYAAILAENARLQQEHAARNANPNPSRSHQRVIGEVVASLASPVTPVAPVEDTPALEKPTLTIVREDIEIGKAFLRREAKLSPGISVLDALDRIGNDELRLLCSRVASGMQQARSAGSTIADVLSIDVYRARTPDGQVHEFVKNNYRTPEEPAQ